MHRIFGVLALAVALVVSLPGMAVASNDPFFPQQWGLANIGAETAWNQSRGAGIVIAIVDTGVDLSHEDLAGKLLPGRSFVGATSPQDDNGHGTHVAGVAAASTGNGLGVAGVAPDASILPVQVLNDRGIGNVNAVAEGIRYAADNGADVINLSFGEVATSVTLAPAFSEAINYAWSKGAIPVVAAGNDFVRSSTFTDEPALVVTATTRGDARPGYASGVGSAQWGIAAPGGDGTAGLRPTCDVNTGIISTYLTSESGGYACLVGSSMAAPHVAGAAAVLRGMGLSPQQVVDRLLGTADDIGSPGADSTFGAGRLNLARAVQAAPAPPPPPPPPPPVPTTTEPPAVVAAVPAPTTTVPSPATTEAPVPTTVPPAPPAEAPTTEAPLPPASGQAIATFPDEGDGTARYVLAVPAAALAVGAGLASWRMRRQLPALVRPGA
ncbi:MAG: S8 family serine peptidase [Acidimicrobiales bacterium]